MPFVITVCALKMKHDGLMATSLFQQLIVGARDLQYISIRQYIDTANKYHDTILYLGNIDISKFSSRTGSDCSISYCNSDLNT